MSEPVGAAADRRILFVAWGEAHIHALAACLAESRLPPHPVVLITDETTPVDAAPPQVTVMRRRFALGGKERKAEALASLPPEFGTVLFLDTDTRVLADVSLGFDKAERHGIAMVIAPHFSLEDSRGFGRVMAAAGCTPRGQANYNSGVLFFDAGAKAVRQVFALALELARRHPERPWGDQNFISLAMELTGFNPYTLAASFNYRGFGELLSGPLRIWHSTAPLAPNAEALAPGFLHRSEGHAFAPVMRVPV